MDSFSSTKSWLIKKAGWSKSNKTSKKSKHGKQHIINKSVETNDSSKNVNNIKDNDNACENINEPIVNKEMINHSFDKPSSDAVEERAFFRSTSVDQSYQSYQSYIKDSNLSEIELRPASNKSIEPIPQLVISNGEISLTSQDLSKNVTEKGIRRRSSSLCDKFDGKLIHMI